MQGAVFTETLRRTWPQMLLWGGALGLMSLSMMLAVPMLDALDFAGMLSVIPPLMLRAAGVGDNLNFVLTPEGLIAVGFFGKFALIFVVYPIVMGMRVTANEEHDGTLDVLLSLPVPRRRLVLEKFAAYALTIAGIAVLIFAGAWIGVHLVDIPLNIGRLAESSLNVLPTLIFVLAFTVFVGAALNRRGVALALVTAFVLVSFMLETVGGMAAGSAAESLRLLSFFNYYNAAGVMQHGLAWANVFGLLVVSAGLLGGALWAFQRRDVGV